MSESLMVGMAEIKVTRTASELLTALGLGSCVGICAYDPVSRVAGMVHVVLPNSNGATASPGKFADTAVPLLLEQMRLAGANPVRIRVALAGGAQLFAFNGAGPKLDIGPRNAAAVQAELQKHGIPVIATDLGGSSGRTVYLHTDGRVRVKTIGRGELQLTALGDGGSSEKAPIMPIINQSGLRTPGLDVLRTRITPQK